MRILSLVGLLLLTTSVNAQKVKVSWGEESKKELEYGSLVKGSGNEMIKLCFESSGGGMFSKRTVTPILSSYDNKLNEKNLRSFTVDEDNINFDELLSIGSNLYMFTNKYERKEKATTFYVQKIDAKKLTPMGASINLGSMAALDRQKQSTANYELSKDSSKILFFGLSPYSRKGNEKYYMAVYDVNMKKLWDNTVELPYLDKYVDVFDFVVTNDGSVGVMLKHYDKEVKKEKVREDGANVPAYKAKFLLYNKGVAKPSEYVLNLDNKFVHNLEVTADDQNNLTLFGLYKSLYNGWVSGYFITTLNKADGKVEVKKLEAFPENLVSLVKTDKQASEREKDPGLSNYFKLADVVERQDGTKDYLLEYYKMQIVTVQSKTGSYSYPVYYYGDIIDIHVTPKKTNFVRLPKWQNTSHTSIYSSFQALTKNNKLYLFYNDDRDNVDRDINKRPDDMIKFGKSVFAMATIDDRDNLTRSMIYDHKEMKLTTCVNVSQRLDKDKLGLYAMRSGGLFAAAKDMIGLVELN